MSSLLASPDRSGAPSAAAEPAAKLGALAHPARLALNRVLQLRTGEPATVAELATALALPVPSTRRHLSVLSVAGLVSVDRTTRPVRFAAVHAVSRELAHSVHSELARQDQLAAGMTSSANSAHLHLLSRVAQQVGDGVALIDPDGWLIYANPAFCAMHGHDEQLAGWHFTAFLPATGQEATLSQLIADAREHGVGRADTWRLRRDGSLFPSTVTLSLLRDDSGQPLSRVLGVQDASERRALEDQLRQQALRDPLTGLPNRRLLLDRLEQALADASRSGLPIAVLFCDLDGFKQVNDRLGHDIGDQLLQQIAVRLSGELRPRDTVARLGGDEFVAVLPDTTLATAHEVAGRLRTALGPALHLAGEQLSVGPSVGVAADRAARRRRRRHVPGQEHPRDLKAHTPAHEGATASQRDAARPPCTPRTSGSGTRACAVTRAVAGERPRRASPA